MIGPHQRQEMLMFPTLYFQYTGRQQALDTADMEKHNLLTQGVITPSVCFLWSEPELNSWLFSFLFPFVFLGSHLQTSKD